MSRIIRNSAFIAGDAKALPLDETGLVERLLDTSPYDDEAVLGRGIEVVTIEAGALQTLAASLDQTFVDACKLIRSAPGRIVVTGMGKSGHVGRKIAATFASTGTPSNYVHPGEAAHGDLGMLVPGDVLMVISNSGNTPELRTILRHAMRIGVKVIGMSSNRQSLVMDSADVCLSIPAVREACSSNIAPTTSTTLQLALGDALAVAVMDMRGFSRDMMKALHPGGAIGLRLLSVQELMHGSNELPLVRPGTKMQDVIVEMTAMSFGVAGVIDEGGRLIGIISDGDLRRNFDTLLQATASEVMTSSPTTLRSNMLAEDAVRLLNSAKITCAFVVDEDAESGCAVPIGIVHIHDFLRIGLA